MITTITILIGNTDNKLTQQEWAEFVEEVRIAIEDFRNDQHFFGGSPTHEKWKNVCWVFTMRSIFTSKLQERLTRIRAAYRQYSVAWMATEPRFI